MIDLIISGIRNALFEMFGYESYADKIPQGLSPPYFYIQCKKSEIKKYTGTRCLRKNHFVIQYFPQSEQNAHDECNSVGEQMFGCLEVINADGLFCFCFEMKFEIVDDVLHFFVDYNAFVKKIVQKETMGGLQTDNHVKG